MAAELHTQTLLTTAELAAAFPCFNTATLRSWRSRGAGGPEFVRVVGKVYYDEATVREWIGERTGRGVVVSS